MADQVPNDGDTPTGDDVETTPADTSVADQLHIAGQGFEALDDGTDTGGDAPAGQTDDPFLNASVQSGRRNTFEQMLGGQPPEGSTVADQPQVQTDPYQGSDPDNLVEAAFEAPQPGRAPGDGLPEIDPPEGTPPGTAPPPEPDQPPPEEEVPPLGVAEDTPEEGAPAGPAALTGDGPPDPPTETPELPEPIPPEAEPVSLTISPADGIEDEPLKLDLEIVSQDEDGTEVQTVTIANVPDGFSFVDGAGNPVGSQSGDAWTFDGTDVGDLWLVRPEHWSGDLEFDVSVVSTERNGDTSTYSDTIGVHVEAVADAPVLNAEDLALTEGEPIPLDITAQLVDADGSETLGVYLTGLPPEATLTHGSQLTAPMEIGGTTLPAGTWVIDPEDLDSVGIVVPDTYSRDLDLNAYAATTEAMNGDAALTGPAPIHVDIGVVAPSVGGGNDGAEHDWIDVDLSAQVNAADGSETLTVLLSDLPAGSELRVKGGGVLTPDSNGVYDVSDVVGDLQVRWKQDDEATKHSDADITFTAQAIVEDTDVGTANESARDTNQTTTEVTVTVDAVADPVTVTISTPATINEDGTIQPDVTATFSDLDGSETHTITITAPDGWTLADDGLGDWTANADGTYSQTVSGGSFSGKGPVFEAPDFSGDATFKAVAKAVETPTEPGTESDFTNNTETAEATATTAVEAVADDPLIGAHDVGGLEGTWIPVPLDQLAATDDSETLTLYVKGVPDGGDLRVVDSNGDPIPGLSVSRLDSDLTLQSGSGQESDAVPSLPAGTFAITVTAGSSATLDDIREGLQVKAAENESTDFTLDLVAVSTEDGSGGTEQAWTSAQAHVDVGVVTPEVTGTTVTGDEAQWTEVSGLNVSIGQLTTEDVAALTDGTAEETVTITVDGLPDGASLRDADGHVLTPGTDGSYDVTDYWDPSDGSVDGLSVRWDDPDAAGDIQFTLNAHLADADMRTPEGTAYRDAEDSPTDPTTGVGIDDETSGSASVTVTVTPRAEAADVTSDAVGLEDNFLPLNLTAEVTDTSEFVSSVQIQGLGDADATLWKWEDDGAGGGQYVQVMPDPGTTDTYTLYTDDGAEDGAPDLSAYAVKPAQHSNDDFALSLSVTTQENAAPFDTHTEVTTVPVTVYGDATNDNPVGVTDSTVHTVAEDSYYQVSWEALANVQDGLSSGDVFASLVDQDGSETISFRLYPDNEDARLRIADADGNGYSDRSLQTDADGNKYFEITPDELSGDRVEIGGPENWAATSEDTPPVTFTLVARNTEEASQEDTTASDSALDGREDHAGNALDDRTTHQDSVIGDLVLKIDPQADELTITVNSAGTVIEDHSVAIDPAIRLQDTDGSEELSGPVYFVTADPDMTDGELTYDPQDGSAPQTLVAQAVTGFDAVGNPTFGGPVQQVDGSGNPLFAYTLDNDWFAKPADGDTYGLSGELTFAPDTDSDADIDYTIYATSGEINDAGLDGGNDRLLTTQDARITVLADADAPDLTTTDAQGMENDPIPLDISAALTDDTAEGLTVYITGVPDGATLSLGYPLDEDLTIDGGPDEADTTIPAGSWVIENADDLSSLTITPPNNDSADFQLGVAAVATEDATGDQAYDRHEVTTGTIFVDVGTRAPTLTLDGVPGTDTNSDGVADTFDLTIDEGTWRDNSNDWQDFDLNATVQAEDGTETLAVHIYDLPDTATLRYQVDGEWQTASPESDDAGHFIIPGDALDSLQIRTDNGVDDDFTVRAQAVVRDVDAFRSADDYADNQTHYDTSGAAPDIAYSPEITVNVTVTAEADRVDASASGVGVEDKWFDLDLDYSVKDTDSEAVTNVVLEGVPQDAVLRYTEDGSGTVIEIPSDGSAIDLNDLSETELASLEAKWPEDLNSWSEGGHDFNLRLKVTTTESGNDADGGDEVGRTSYTTTKHFKVKVFGDADALVDGQDGEVHDATYTVDQGEFHTLTFGTDVADVVDGNADVFAALRDTDGSEELVFHISPSDPDARLLVDGEPGTWVTETDEHGNVAAEYWEVSYDDLAAGRVSVGGGAFWSSHDSDDQLDFSISAVVKEDDAHYDATDDLDGTGLTREGTAKTDLGVISLTVDPVAGDVRLIRAENQGLEDQTITVTPTIEMSDTDGSETLTGTVWLMTQDADMLAGTLTLNGTDLTAYEVNPDGSVNLGAPLGPNDTPQPGTTYAYAIDADDFTAPDFDNGGSTYDLSGLTFTPETHNSNEVTYTIQATVTDAGMEGDVTDNTAVVTGSGSIQIDSVADAPTVDLETAAGTYDGTSGTVAAGSGGADYAVTGVEDTYIRIDVDAALVDQDGSETLEASITGVPDGWTVGYWNADTETFTEAGDLGDGEWSLTPGMLDNADLVVRPPEHLHVPAGEAPTLSLHVTSRENGSDGDIHTETATTTTTFTVEVTPEADAPNLLVNPVSTLEDQAVDLDIRPALIDQDGSETLSVFIVGDFKGGSLIDSDGNPVGTAVTINGQDGYEIPLDALDDLRFDPKPDSNEDPALQVIARATETDGSVSPADRVVPLDIRVKGVVDGVDEQDLSVTITEPTTGSAQAHSLGLGALVSLDVDGSETVSVIIKSVDPGVTVEMGSGPNGEDLSGYMKYVGDGKWAVEAGYLEYVQATVTDPDFSGTKAVEIDVVTTESDGAYTVVDKTVSITVEPDADQPSISIGGTTLEDAAGGAAVDVGFGAADLVAGDGEAERIVSFTLDIDTSGLPADFDVSTLTLEAGGRTWSVGPGNEITLTAADGESLDPSILDGLTLHGLPEHWSDNLPVTASVTVDDNGDIDTRTATGSVRIIAQADEVESASVSTGSGTAEFGDANGIVIDIDIVTQANDDEFVETYVIKDVPDGVRLNKGWQIGSEDGGNVWMIDAKDITDGDPLRATADWPIQPGTLHVYAQVVDEDHDAGDGRDTRLVDVGTADVTFTDENGGYTGGPDVPDRPTVGVPDIDISLHDATEDGWFHLDAQNAAGDAAISVTPGEGDDTITAIVITDLPDGAEIRGPYVLDPTGDPNNPAYIIDPARIGEIEIKPPPNMSGVLSIGIKAVAVDSANPGMVAESASESVVLAHVAPVSDAGAFSLSVASGPVSEDPSDPIDLTVAFDKTDPDGNGGTESLADGGEVTISGLPDGAKLFLDGDKLEPNGDGEYTLTVSDFGSINGLSVQPPPNYHGTMALSFTASVVDSVTIDGTTLTADPTSTTAVLNIPVEAVAETDLAVGATDVRGDEDTAITLDISAMTDDLAGTGDYGSESISVVISGVPEGAVLKNAENTGSYTENGQTYTIWTIKSALVGAGAISGVTITPPEDYSGTMELTVKAYAIEPSNGDISEASQSFNVVVDGVSDTPTVNPQHIGDGQEDTPVKLELNANAVDPSESGSLLVTIDNVPDGARLTDANGNPLAGVTHVAGTSTWTVQSAVLDQVYFVGPPEASGTYTMTAMARTTDVDAAGNPVDSAESGTVEFSVTLSGVADAPTLTVGDTTPTVAEDTLLPLDLTASLGDDLDGSETLMLYITGAEPGTRFIAGGQEFIADANGATAGIDAAYISDLAMRAPDNYHGTMTLEVTARSSEDGTHMDTSETVVVDVTSVNDDPTVSLESTSQTISGTVNSIHVVPGADGTGEAITFADAADGGTTLHGLEITLDDVPNGDGDLLTVDGLDFSSDGFGNTVVTLNGQEFGIDWTADPNGGGTLTFTGDADFDTYAKLAESVVLSSPNGSLSEGERSISFTAIDEDGGRNEPLSATANVEGTVTLNSLHGTAGNDDFAPNLLDGTVTDDGVTIFGGSGLDSLFMHETGGLGIDWTVAETDTQGIWKAEAAGQPDLFIHLDDPNAVLGTESNGDHQALTFEGSGQITFDQDGSQSVAVVEDMEKIVF